jgi:hypothetical protein
MAIVQFIDTDYLKQNSTIEMNVDDSKLNPMILKVQMVYLQQSLGSSFLNHLYTAVSGSTLTSAEESLIRDFIQPMVVEYTVYEVLPFLNFKATNKAISKQNSDNSTPSDLSEIKYLRSNVKDMAEFMDQRLVKFLCDNSNLFPEYLNPSHPENLPKKSKPYFTGVYIPKKGTGGLRVVDDESDNCDC